MSAKVLFAGDSTVAEWYHNQHPDQTGVMDVVRELGAAAFGSSSRFVCIGEGGTASSRVAAYLETVLGEDTWDAVVILAGTNDVAASIAAATILTTFAGMAADCLARGPDVAFVPCTVPPVNTWTTGGGSQNEILDTLNAGLRSAYPLAYVERNGLVRDPADVTNILPAFLIASEPADFTHLNTAGNEHLGGAIIGRLVGLLS